ncbi:MAG: chromosomal replication initiator protein DnaA [Verrucomicrobia bacterium]|nr:chromosomal replication initiator protein DnaA [Verrucomicrobiota bacterium]MBU6445913.1 chromosomal replication initiator protein DnaA [Verrucomicrobiota bacterium]MDE3046975.1 chromosomal replication initiator protein DnaA [Verrucomicrobiota bacterium]
MLDCGVKNGWIQFIEFIESRCSSAEFQNWIAPIRLVEANPEKVILEVPNVYVQDYLLDNFKEVLCNFLPLLASGEPAVQFLMAAENPLPVAAAPEPVEELPANEFCLNPLYTFENFIEGPSNQFVKSAAFGIASRPGKSYNPLFIHGGVGLGKTHLLHSIGHYAKEHHRKLRVQVITTEAFINDIVDHLKAKSIDKMKRFYRTLDVLLIDDIQFLQNRLGFEEEFCNTFETLLNQNKQIVITSDKPPAQLKLSERMVARLEWGLVAHMGVPDLETRVAIIKHKSERRGLSIPSQIAFFIAEHIYNNVRQIEGAINRLCAHSKLMSENLNEEVVEKILSELFQHNAPNKKISVEEILKSVAAVFEVRISEIKGESRHKEIALARQVAMYLAKEMIDDSLMKIASSFGGKTHSTLLHAWKKITDQIQINELLRRQVQMIRRNIETV